MANAAALPLPGRSMALAMSILSVLFGAASSADQAQEGCSWSPVWKEVMAPFEGRGGPGAKLTEPRRTKGSLERPPSDVQRVIDGIWVVEAVIDEKGKVRDVRIIKTPRIDPPWPEYEAAVLKSVRKWKYSPLLRDGQPWPNCMTIRARDR